MEKQLAPSNATLSLSKPSHSDVMHFCVKSYLLDIKGSKNELERVLERYEKLNGCIAGIDYSKKIGGGVTSTNSTTEDKLVARMEAYDEYKDVLDQVRAKIEYARYLIGKTPYGYLLWAHYIYDAKWKTLSLRERVNERTMRRWKSEAIETLYCIMPEQYRRYTIPNATPI